MKLTTKQTTLLTALTLLLASFFIATIFSQQAIASPTATCSTPIEGRPDANVIEAEQRKADFIDYKSQFLACATVFIQGASPRQVVAESCPDGSQPCFDAVKQFCGRDSKGIIFGRGVSASLCMPFGFML